MFDRMQYRMMVSYYALVGWLQSRFTPAGKFVLVGIAVAAPFSLIQTKTLAYQIFTFLFILLSIAFLFSFFFTLRFSAQRRLPRMATVGQPISYKCFIENQTETTQTGLAFIEKIEEPKPSFKQFIALTAPSGTGRSKINQILERDMIRVQAFKKTQVNLQEKFLHPLAPHKKTEVSMTFTPFRRGYMRLSGMSLIRTDPLGLYRSTVTVPCEQSLLVLPRLYRTPAIQLAGSRKHNQRGVALASQIGDSEEFVGLRDYRAGDPLRTIHWKSWAKVGKPVVKQYQDEFFSRYALIMDTFTPTDSALFEEAVSVAASFSTNMDLSESLLDLMFVGTEAFCFTSGRSLGHSDQMLEILASVKICSDASFRSLKDLVMSRSALLSGSICIFLNWDEDRRNLIAQLKSLNVPLIVCVVHENATDAAVDLGPMKDDPENFHLLKVGEIEEGLKSV